MVINPWLGFDMPIFQESPLMLGWPWHLFVAFFWSMAPFSERDIYLPDVEVNRGIPGVDPSPFFACYSWFTSEIWDLMGEIWWNHFWDVETWFRHLSTRLKKRVPSYAALLWMPIFLRVGCEFPRSTWHLNVTATHLWMMTDFPLPNLISEVFPPVFPPQSMATKDRAILIYMEVSLRGGYPQTIHFSEWHFPL